MHFIHVAKRRNFTNFRIFRRNIFYFGQISRIFVCAKVFILAKIVQFSENRCNIHIFAKMIKVVLKSNSFHSASHLLLCLVLIFAKTFGKLTLSRKYMYDRKNILENKPCRENLPTSHVVQTFFQNWSLYLTCC
jgi:hypothetical protein